MDWEIAGHEWAIEMLKTHAAVGTERHAYLFTGPPGSGRRTLALRFAQSLNCTEPIAPGVPCRSCRICRQIERMQHPDLFVVQSEQEGREIKIDQIRALQHSLSLAPFEARYRIGLILRFQEARKASANALLKTLEEAPTRAILLLTANSPASVLPTIASRCEVFNLRPLNLEKLTSYLHQEHDLEPGLARLYAHLAGGRVGYALNLAHDAEHMDQRRDWLDELARLLHASRRDRFAYAATLAKDREKLRQAILVWLSYWRDVLLCTANVSAPLVNLDREDEIQNVAVQMDLYRARALVVQAEKHLDQLEHYVNPRQVAEVMMLDWPRL